MEDSRFVVVNVDEWTCCGLAKVASIERIVQTGFNSCVYTTMASTDARKVVVRIYGGLALWGSRN